MQSGRERSNASFQEIRGLDSEMNASVRVSGLTENPGLHERTTYRRSALLRLRIEFTPNARPDSGLKATK
jgi:hypothetical protein